MGKSQQRSYAKKLAFVLGLLTFATVPAMSFAERPEIDCQEHESEFGEKQARFVKELQKDSDTKFADALPYVLDAMKVCTTDVYTEYTLARIYELTGDCASAFYHYEMLMNRPNKVQKENRDIYKNVKENFKKVASQCGDVVTLEIECETEGTELSISGFPQPTVSCPFYGKIKPGSYTIVASKEGFQKKQENVIIPEEGAEIRLSALEDMSIYGVINIRCPKDVASFTMMDENNKKTKYVCPTLGMKVPAGTYKIFRNETDEVPVSTVTVAKQATLDHMIPSETTTISCSGTPTSNNAAPAAWLFALLGVLGIGAARRRREQ